MTPMTPIIILKKSNFLELLYKASLIQSDPRFQEMLKLCPEFLRVKWAQQNEIIEASIDFTIKADIHTVNKLAINQKLSIQNTLADAREQMTGTVQHVSDLSGKLNPDQAEHVVSETLNSVGPIVRMTGDMLQGTVEQLHTMNQLAQYNLIDGASMYNHYMALYTAVGPIIGS
nr:hypothetical protein [Amanita sp. CQC-2022a]WIF29660.1 hypothetical protein [Amanita sp. CQC-2022a]